MYSLIEMKEPSLYITLLNEILIKQLKVWKKFKVHRQKYAAFQQRNWKNYNELNGNLHEISGQCVIHEVESVVTSQ